MRTRRPLAQVTGSSFRATVTTSTPSSGQPCAQELRTSHGPAQSSSSAPSNRKIPIRMEAVCHRAQTDGWRSTMPPLHREVMCRPTPFRGGSSRTPRPCRGGRRSGPRRTVPMCRPRGAGTQTGSGGRGRRSSASVSSRGSTLPSSVSTARSGSSWMSPAWRSAAPRPASTPPVHRPRCITSRIMSRHR